MLLVPHRKFESMQAKHVYPFKQHYRASIKDHVDVADPPRADSNSDGESHHVPCAIEKDPEAVCP